MRAQSVLLPGVILTLVFSIPLHPAAAAEPPQVQYLGDDLADRISDVIQAWGELGFNTAVRPATKPPTKLQIGDKEYARGLGSHANGEITVDLGGQFKTFQAEIGIQRQPQQGEGTVVFQVFVDDEKRFDSGVVTQANPPQELTIPVEGAEELRLVVTDAGDGITCDCANWAEARLIRDPSARPQPPRARVDVARFARIVTWDPSRTTGTAARRTEEFPAEDLFLETEVVPAAGGAYTAPVGADGLGCIGLRWYELRNPRQLFLEPAEPAAFPAADAIRLEYWTGESPWQGEWKPLEATVERAEGRWLWQVTAKDLTRGTQKVRWVFPAGGQPIVLKSLSAYTRALWKTVALRLQSQRASAGKPVKVRIYNGLILDPAGEGSLERSWDIAAPLALKVRASSAKRFKVDRTVLQIEQPEGTVAVAVEDVLANGAVYVPHAGLLVAREPAPVTLEAHLREIAGRTTVLEQVRELPDQSYSQAMAKTHNPVQNFGPMLLSLACDNRKFTVHREGPVCFHLGDAPDGQYPSIFWHPRLELNTLDCHQVVPRFGSGTSSELTRHLDGGWLPRPITALTDGGVVYRQGACVTPLDKAAPAGAPRWLRERAVCIIEYTVENPQAKPAEVALVLTFLTSAKNNQHAELREVEGGITALSGSRLMGLVSTAGAGPLSARAEAGVVSLSGKLPAGGTARLLVYLPAWKLAPDRAAELAGGSNGAEELKAYWDEVLSEALQLELPDQALANVIRASQVHCMLAARNEDRGARISPWIASDRYGPLESESQAVIRGMDMTGCGDFARRGLEFFLKRYNEAGFLTTGYTIVGTGENLWTLAEHFRRTGDQAWMKGAAPIVARACQWIARTRQKTMRLDARGEKPPEFGLMPPGVTADWGRYAYRYFNDAQYCTGLKMAADALAEIGHPDAAALRADAKQYREDLLRAYRWTQSRSPVVPLQNGTWVPNCPAMLDCFGNIEDFLPGEDGNRSWAYSVEIGTNHLVATGVLDADSHDAAWIADYAEDVQYLRTGMNDYPEEKNRSDIFNFGGFAKVQPYYGRIAEVHALRDDVRPFVRSYFNALASLLSEENLSLWEHFHNTAGWNKTHETGWFLCQTGTMLAMERKGELWLAPLVPEYWLEDGKQTSVRNLPTPYGKVSYQIASSVAQGRIEARIEPPARQPERIVLRLRHPKGRPIRAVQVNGQAHRDFDAERQCVRLAPQTGAITVSVEY
ncbi:MAG: NPCBM/NEW2 domain-containing protein [Thermoguttaceae bacterium]|jgi:hypothetical protein